MILTKAQAILVFKKAGVAYSGDDTLEALCVAMKEFSNQEIAEKQVKGAFDVALQSKRRIVTRQDIETVVAGMGGSGKRADAPAGGSSGGAATIHTSAGGAAPGSGGGGGSSNHPPSS